MELLNKNKKIMILAFAVTIILITAVSLTGKTTFVKIEADQDIDVSSLEDLEKYSDIIVRAVVLPGSVNVTETKYATGYTVTDIEVVEAFQGPVNAGDILTLTESYYIVNSGWGKEIWHINNYAPSRVNEEYIFFLRSYGDTSVEKFVGKYHVTGVDMGKYPIIGDLGKMDKRSLTPEMLNIAYESARYLNVMKDVLNKYAPQ